MTKSKTNHAAGWDDYWTEQSPKYPNKSEYMRGWKDAAKEEQAQFDYYDDPAFDEMIRMGKPTTGGTR